jgi:hypothetical protein
MDAIDDYKVVEYVEEPLDEKLIDYAGRRWSDESMVWVRRRTTLNPPPESFSLLTPLYNDRQLVSNYEELNRRF